MVEMTVIPLDMGVSAKFNGGQGGAVSDPFQLT
jgi:hypothetical protein